MRTSVVCVIVVLAAAQLAACTSLAETDAWAASMSSFLNGQLLGSFGKFDQVSELLNDRLSRTPLTTTGKELLASVSATVQTNLLTHAQHVLDMASLFEQLWLNRSSLPTPAPGDTVVANDAATLPPLYYSDFYQLNVSNVSSASVLLLARSDPDPAVTDQLRAVSFHLTDSMARFAAASAPASTPAYQFFGAYTGYTRVYPVVDFASDPTLAAYDASAQPWLVNAAAGRKDFVVLLDVSRDFRGQRAATVAAAVAALLRALTPSDYTQLLVVADPSGDLQSSPLFPAAARRLLRATAENVDSLVDYLYALNASHAATVDLNAAVRHALDFLAGGSTSGCTQTLLVVSMSAQLDRSSQLLSTAAPSSSSPTSGPKLLYYSFVPPSAQASLTACRSDGLSFYVTDANATLALSRAYLFLAADVTPGVQWLPHLGFAGAALNARFGLTLTVSQAVYDRSGAVPRFLGAVGVDVPLDDIYTTIDSLRYGLQYAALITTDGDVVLHPSFKMYSSVAATPYMIDVSALEVEAFAASVRPAIVSAAVGQHRQTVLRAIPNWAQSAGTVLYNGLDLLDVDTIWNWQRLVGLPFVAYSIHAATDLVYLDYSSNDAPHPFGYTPTYSYDAGNYYPDSVDVFTQLGVPVPPVSDPLRGATLFPSNLGWKMGPRAYLDPAGYVRDGQHTRAWARSVNAYVSERYAADALVNPGLSRSAKDVIRALSPLQNMWLDSFNDTQLAAVSDGIALIYVGHDSSYIGFLPGITSPISNLYDATQRGWYIRAKGRPGDACFTTPYLDAFGAGVITSLGKSLAAADKTVGVLSFDFVYANLHALSFADTGCNLPGRPTPVTCFAISNAGLFVLVDSFLDPQFVADVDSGRLSGLNYFLGAQESALARRLVDVGFLVALANDNWPGGFTSFVYQTDDSVLDAAGGHLTGAMTIGGGDCSSGTWTLTRVPATNSYLIVVDDYVHVNDSSCRPYIAPPPVPLRLNQTARYLQPLPAAADCPASLPLRSQVVEALESARNAWDVECALSAKQLVEVSLGLRIAMTVVAAVAFVFWLLVLVIVLLWRSRPVMFASSITFCVVIIVGGLGLFATVWTWYPSPMTKSSCLAYLWLWGTAAELAIAPIFIKAWRVWMIFRAAEKFKRVAVPNHQLLAFVAVLFAVNVVYLIVWSAVDPYQAVADYTALDNTDEYLIACDSRHFDVWIGILIAWFGAQVLVCCVLAFMTRKVSSAFADSKLTVLIVYCIAFAAAILVPLVFLLDFVPDAVYLIRHVGLVGVTCLCLGIFFFPKIWVVVNNQPGSQPGDNAYLQGKLSRTTAHTSSSMPRTTGVAMTSSN